MKSLAIRTAIKKYTKINPTLYYLKHTIPNRTSRKQ